MFGCFISNFTMSLTSIQRIMQKGLHSFGQNTNGANRKRHNLGDPSAIVNLCLPNGDVFEERCYIKEPLAQQITRILNELRRQGSTFMKKKYYYHALHPVDLLIIDEDHKFIPNERPPGNWPTVVKCIMQERKPHIYVWSFKFCERDKVSFPDVAHMTEHHKFFEDKKKSGTIDESLNSPQNSGEILRTNSSLEFSSKKIPNQFCDSQSPPKAKPRVRGNNLANSISQLNNHAPPPLPPKTKFSSLNCLEERNGLVNLQSSNMKFNSPSTNGTLDQLASDIQEFSITRNRHNSKRQPLLPPTTPLFSMNFDESGSKIPSPLPPLRNSSTRKCKFNSFVLPVSPDEEFSQASNNSSNFSRDLSFYQQERDDNFYQDISYNSSFISPSTPPYPPYSPVIPPILSNSNPSSHHSHEMQVSSIQAYKIKHESSPRMSLSLYEADEENFTPIIPKYKNGFINCSPGFAPILPAIPPKMRNLKTSIPTPIAKPRRKRTDTPNGIISVHTRNNTAPASASFHPMPLPQNHLSVVTPNYPRIVPPTANYTPPPELPPKKQNRHTTEFITPKVPPRPPKVKTHHHQVSAFHPFNY